MTTLRIATRRDLPALLEFRASSEEWLAQRQLDQYQNYHDQIHAREHIAELVKAGRFVALTRDGQDLLAAGALVGPDMDFWTAADDLNSAWYVGRLMVKAHGKRYGERLIDFLAVAAGLDGRKWLRLDCWKTNRSLHAYYESIGFLPVRTANAPGRTSGALFQRPTSFDLPTPWDSPGAFVTTLDDD